MKKILYRLIPLVTVFSMLLTSVIFLSLGWFSLPSLLPTGGEVMVGYFAGGDGSAADPYVITKPIHLYNLAWLQNLGRFNELDDKGALKQFHFVLKADITMPDDLILPPIGTAENPFVGTFTSLGDVYTIKNLTVSNTLVSGEINKRPQNVTSLDGAEIIGMFGIIGQYNNVPADAIYSSITPSVSNFFLEDPEIRARTPNALAGLIAGYVNGNLLNVGVSKGKILSGSQNSTGLSGYGATLSNYALIGDIGDDVFWDGVTNAEDDGDEAGGAIEIIPGQISAVTSGSAPVPGAVDDHAFLIANIGKTSWGNLKAQIYRYGSIIQSVENQTAADVHTLNPGTNGSFKINSVADTGDPDGDGPLAALHPKFKGLITNSAGTTIALQSQNVLTFNYSTSLVPCYPAKGDEPYEIPEDWVEVSINGDKDSIMLPDNAIWFKPLGTGICEIAFACSNMKGSYYKSLYRFKREVIDGVEYITKCYETKLVFVKEYLGNGNIISYQYMITDADLPNPEDPTDTGYEFAIGLSYGEGADSSAFYFLALAGADDDGGDKDDGSTASAIVSANFVPTGYTGAVADTGMVVTTFKLDINKTLGGEANATFQRLGEMSVAGTTATSNGFTVTKEDEEIKEKT